MPDEQSGLFVDPSGEHGRLDLQEDAAPAPAHTLDGSQGFRGTASYVVREELQALVQRDLLGPWDGETEQFPPRAQGPRERYLVGMLGPKHSPESTTKQADQLPDTELGTEGDGEAELPDVLTAQNLGRIWASSMGLSFAVPTYVDLLTVTATWGHYAMVATKDGDGKKRQVWARVPESYQKEVRLDGPPAVRIPLTGTHPDQPGMLLAVAVRFRGGRRVVELALINAQVEPASNGDTAWLFQAQLTVTALDGQAAIFLPIDDPLDDLAAVAEDPEEAHLRLLYRHHRRYASGRNIAVHATISAGSRRAHRLETTWLPVADVPATVAPTGGCTELSMDALATADRETLRAGLMPLVDGYRSWLDDRQAEIPGLPEPLCPAAENALHAARRAAERIRAGVALLTDPEADRHDQALQAFRFANLAMADQRRNTAIAALRAEHDLDYPRAKAKVKEQGAKAASWRPFQLAFVLLNLPSLTDLAHPERAADATATVDLLFFPTGGGKTEAYLGLTAYTFAIRRLQGTLGAAKHARDGSGGVAVLMRYTLRLLTAQQFQRAAALVCAAEMLRRADPATWGWEPFRIGLWVGGGVSPNWWDEAERQIAEAREAGDARRTNVLQTLSCPWCGTALRAQHDLQVREADRRVRLFCSNAEGASACPFSQRQCADGLPILTVDEEIYRYAPSMVIATVDKLAQLPWRAFAGMLFGRVSSRCPRHGYRHADFDDRVKCGERHNAKSGLPAVTSQPVVRLRPPDLIIQDELHLISGALGTTVGLFEAAVDELCTWHSPDGSLTGPKIVASTATTKRAREQVLGVFGRDLAVFPPQVIDVADTFFSRQVPVTSEHPGRRYLGVCAHGVRLKSAEIRLAEILLIAGQTLFDTYGNPADPYMTLVGYFNATRELAGMRRYLDDQVTTRVRTHGRRKGLSDRIVSPAGMLTIQELTSRISSGDISDVLKRLEIGFDADLDTSTRRRAITQDFREYAASKGKQPMHPLTQRGGERARTDRIPVDVVLATSMLQVGVDVSRFGLMVVTGQPKNTAEYIQASSRVGRAADRPGLVVTLYNWARPRDLAHYEDFEYYHATFYRQVEALSVTPYTRRALDRGTAATFVAAIRNAEDGFSRNTDAHDVPLDGPVVARITARLLARAEAVAGPRGRDYLAARITVITDQWRQRRTGQVRLGYKTSSTGGQQLLGLLDPAGNGRWGDLTVGMSMRETENEVNLLLSGGGEIYSPLYNEPDWAFTSAPTGDANTGQDDPPEGDELGESSLSVRSC
jgi:hypothetical protein